MGVTVVTVEDITEDIIVRHWGAFGLKFVVTTLCTNLWRGCDKDLQLGVREDDRTYVTAVHDNAFGTSHGLLERNELLTDERDG